MSCLVAPFKVVYWLLNILALAAYAVGHAALGAFLVNTRILGVRDSRTKQVAILSNLAAWPAGGLLYMLLSGGPGAFLASLFVPLSRSWLWRAFFTFHGARYIYEEIYNHRNPRLCSPEVLSEPSEHYDLREEVAHTEGQDLSGLKGLVARLNEVHTLEITHHDVRLACLPPEFDGFRILQVADTHNGDFASAEFTLRYVQLAIEQDPDIVVLTGDFQQYHKDVVTAATLMSPFARWSAERRGKGVFAALGNHDTAAGTAFVTEALRRAGIPVLNNKYVRMERDGAALYIAGVADPWSFRASLPRTLLGVPDDACVVLLAHEPDYLIESSRHNIAFQLSGHLHGGQIKLPFIGPLMSPSRYGRRYIEGFYKRNNTLMYVSRGLGGHPYVRFSCKPEISVLTLRADGDHKAHGETQPS